MNKDQVVNLKDSDVFSNLNWTDVTKEINANMHFISKTKIYNYHISYPKFGTEATLVAKDISNQCVIEEKFENLENAKTRANQHYAKEVISLFNLLVNNQAV